ADAGISGAFNTVSQPGHATMESLLNACVAATGSDARLVWAEPAVIEAAEIEGWTGLPVWISPEGEGGALHDGGGSAMSAAGLGCRPVEDTVADTWGWLEAEGDPPVRAGRPQHGIDPEKERKVLASLI